MGKFKRKILVDLDGVLNNYEGVYDENYIPELKDGAIDFLEKLYESYDLVLFTSRNLLLARKWLVKNKIDRYITNITNIKEPSFLIIDDRCINFNGNYDETLEKIKNFKVWYK